MLEANFFHRTRGRTHKARFDLGSDEANALAAVKYAWDHNCEVVKLLKSGFDTTQPVRVVEEHRDGTVTVERVWTDGTLARFRFDNDRFRVQVSELVA